jgi:hypothetical protein
VAVSGLALVLAATGRDAGAYWIPSRHQLTAIRATASSASRAAR